MSIVKPYTFTAGTKARANEVNADFDTLYTQVNSNISAIADNADDIDELDSTKADLNGSSSQRFAVANPVNTTDAVNKQSLTSAIGNSIDLISGLIITKDSNSPEDTIIVDTGSAYDSTKAVVLTLSASTTKENTGQGASTTYYVHIIGNSTGSSTDILISSSKLSPTLPSGYTLFRCIGRFITDSNNQITVINSFGIPTGSSVTGIANVVYKYTSGNVGYRIWSDGYCEQWGVQYHSGGASSYYTITFLKAFANGNYNVSGAWDARENVGDKQFSWRISNRSTTTMTMEVQTEGYSSTTCNIFWKVSGYLASGQY